MAKKAATRSPPKRPRLYRKTPQKPVEPPPWLEPAWYTGDVLPKDGTDADVELRANGTIITGHYKDGRWHNAANGKVVDVARWRVRP